MSSPRLLSQLVAGLYAPLVILVTASAICVWRIRCEGFGCTGVGVAWVAWALFFLAVLVVGLVVRRWTQLSGLVRRSVRWALVAQLLVGAFLVSAWVLHTAA
ncbi:hypothetical protein ACVNIS_01725 [Sphaerotilaceae bacterium SBD11-9]